MMTTEQRTSLIKFLKNDLNKKKQFIDDFKENERVIEAFINSQDNERISNAAIMSFLLPQKEQIQALSEVITRMEHQIQKLENSEIEEMTDEEAIEYINPN